MSTRESDSSFKIEEKKIDINGVGIFYCRAGKGSHVVLFIPGSMGAVESDYEHQLYDMDAEKFTLVVLHPPGLGKSRPPDRMYPDDYLQRDATCGYNLMKILGYSKFSVVGWLNGGSVALVMAAMFPDSIHKVVVSNAKAVITKKDVDTYNDSRDINSWGPNRRDQLVAIYGKQYLNQIWTGLVEKMIEIYEKKGGDLCLSILRDVHAPTLVLYGNQEKLVDISHVKQITDHVKNSKAIIIDGGQHNMHAINYQQFNEHVTKFLLEE